MKEIRALFAALIVFFVVVAAAAVVVLFVLPPVVATPIGDCERERCIIFKIRKATQYSYQLRLDIGFPCRAGHGASSPKIV